MTYLAEFLLVAFLATIGLRTKDDAKVYAAFKLLESTHARCLEFRRWTIESFLLYGVGSLAGLALLGELSSLILPPAAFIEGARALKVPMIGDTGDTESFSMGLIIGVALVTGAALGTALSIKRRGGRTRSRNVALGDIESLLPRNAQERWWAVLISVNAGLSEEMFFRLLLPLLIYRVFGNVFAALGIPIIVFGCVHFYQGWKGVAATTVVGGLFTAVFLGSGRICYAMALHALMDLYALLLMPMIGGGWKKR